MVGAVGGSTRAGCNFHRVQRQGEEKGRTLSWREGKDNPSVEEEGEVLQLFSTAHCGHP